MHFFILFLRRLTSTYLQLRMNMSSTMYPPATPTRPPREPARPARTRTLPTVPSASVVTDSNPPPYQDLQANDSAFYSGTDFQQIPDDDLSTQTLRSAASPQETDPANESNGGDGTGSKPPPTPNTPTTPRIRPTALSPMLSASPLSTHPESTAFAYYPYYMWNMFSVTTHSE